MSVFSRPPQPTSAAAHTTLVANHLKFIVPISVVIRHFRAMLRFRQRLGAV
jgi:hypothetical protein